jgi:excisionase family DNA binding protein
MEETSRLLTVKETCKYLRISAPTLYRMLERKELIPVKIGKRTLFDRKDLDAYIDASKGPAPKKRTKKVGRPKGSKAKPKVEVQAEPKPKREPKPKPKEKEVPLPDRLF